AHRLSRDRYPRGTQKPPLVSRQRTLLRNQRPARFDTALDRPYRRAFPLPPLSVITGSSEPSALVCKTKPRSAFGAEALGKSERDAGPDAFCRGPPFPAVRIIQKSEHQG